MNRRNLLKIGTNVALATAVLDRRSAKAAPRKFKLMYAPHFGMFKHHAGEDLIDQIKFMNDQGFMAIEDNGLPGRPVDVQEKIGKELAKRGMTMGVFVSIASFDKVTFASNDPANAEKIVKDAEAAVEVAKRVNAKWTTVVPGRFDTGREWDYQTAYVIDNLKRAAAVFEKNNVVMVLEPLNPYRDHPGLFLTKIPQSFQICRAVGSPSCKTLFDMYHQQITEGNIIPNIDRAWEEVVYFQVGDNPGRKEPTTGEMNYNNIFKHIHSKGYKGVVGMEHGNSKKDKAGEKAVIDAYVACDRF
ncbi:MAG: TIM barrel protein [Deltaproteobacteria bacterium]|nr:TIM barrel protein [Deltaproteobacteria bacterium]